MTTQLNDKLIAVDVPADAKDFYIDYNCELRFQSNHDWRGIMLPDINYSILGLCSPTEIGFDCEKCLKVAGVEFTYNEDWLTRYDNAKQSFRSLLQSKGLDLEKCYLIIEKQSIMKYNNNLPEDAFIPWGNKDGGQYGHSQFGAVVHFLVEKQNTTINPKYKARCGKIMQGFEFNFANPRCNKCFNQNKPNQQ